MKKGVKAGITLLLMCSVWGTSYARTQSSRSFNLWPLFYYEGKEEEGTKTGEVLWPFFSFESSPKEYTYALRPLFRVHREKNSLLREVQFLWPLGWYKSAPDQKKLRLFPFFYYNKYTLPGGEEKSDYTLFPFFFGSRSNKEDGYFAFFPLGGRLNRWLGKDRVRFFLFPLYADTVKGDYRSWYVLWPVFSFAKGKGAGAYRFWPLFGHGYKTGEYSKTFVLWPLFNFQKTELNGENLSESLMMLPFYAYQKYLGNRTEAVLWPFFTYTDNRRENYKEWHFPWPIFSRTRGEDRRGDELWPLWGYQRKGDRERFYAFWPLYWSLKENSGGVERRRTIVLPVYWNEREIWPKENKSASYTRIWPLLSYERDKDGALKLSLLSPLWFRAGAGFQKNYSAFWTLYEYRKDREGNRFSKVLWRLYRHERTKHSHSLELIHLLAYQREGKDNIRFSFLKGLFEYKRRGEKKYLRFFYFLKFPLGRSK